MKYFSRLILFSFVIGFAFSSCTSRKKITYLQTDKEISAKDTIYKLSETEYIISAGDVLYINFYSLTNANVNNLADLFNNSSGNTPGGYSMWNSEASQYVNGFLVDTEGKVTIPLIGSVKVSGYTVEAIQKLIEEKAKQFVNDVSVVVKFISFNYTVMGEVARPGTYTRYNSRLNLFQALAKAGDVTVYGDKTKVEIVRETKEGRRVYRFDMTKENILSSEVFNIMPNDIIYVESLGNKSFRQNLPNISIILSSISTIILVLNFVNKK